MNGFIALCVVLLAITLTIVGFVWFVGALAAAPAWAVALYLLWSWGGGSKS